MLSSFLFRLCGRLTSKVRNHITEYTNIVTFVNSRKIKKWAGLIVVATTAISADLGQKIGNGGKPIRLNIAIIMAASVIITDFLPASASNWALAVRPPKILKERA